MSSFAKGSPGRCSHELESSESTLLESFVGTSRRRCGSCRGRSIVGDAFLATAGEANAGDRWNYFGGEKLSKNRCILVDLDGTVADCQHRRHFVDGTDGPKNWDKFFDPKLVAKDPVIPIVRDAVVRLGTLWPVFYVTARREDLRYTTIDWLRKNGLWFFPYRLLMRKNGDRRDDTDVKRDILNDLRAEGYEPIAAVDDRAKVVAMWRSEGLTCFQVAEGDF